MVRNNHNKYKKVLIVATVLLGVMLVVFVVLAQFFKVFFLCSYIAIGVYFVFFIIYQVCDTVAMQKNKTKKDRLDDYPEK